MATANSINANSTGLANYDGAGTWTGVTVTQHDLLVGGSSNAITSLALTNGQLPIGNSGSDPTAATLTAGTGVSISNGAGSITINALGGGLSWSVVTGTTQTAAVNNGYVANNAGTVTVTLPATAAVGDCFAVTGMNNATGWKLAVTTGQTIYFGSTNTTVTTGYLQSTKTHDSVFIVCNVANTSFIVLNAVGNITVV
ncbi:MAG: hypothetical protein KGI50_05230 [Patescibacteria group bacterium]|nr:hypothetical protein [Patescibacteria group bacterium]MDE2438738.1 hypothetical protein [Patescibacteria group bacterium]